MIIQQPKQLKENKRWKMVETSDEDSTHFIELCPCTLGHAYEYEAKHCAKVQEFLNNPVLLAQKAEEIKCYKCKFYANGLENTRLSVNTTELTGVFRGTVFREFCTHPDTQSEADDYNENYADLLTAEARCDPEDDYNYQYFESK